jgi:hypothetical protein
LPVPVPASINNGRRVLKAESTARTIAVCWGRDS